MTLRMESREIYNQYTLILNLVVDNPNKKK